MVKALAPYDDWIGRKPSQQPWPLKADPEGQ